MDVQASPIDYINRAKELGHTAYFTTEHGCNGNAWEAYDLCKKNDLKMINGMECYFTYDRHIVPSPNWHIVIIGLNYDAFEELNYINSMANIDGFYYNPRVDMELLLSLNPKNFIITTACINNPLFFSKDYNRDALNEYLLPLFFHFGENLFIEIQSHNDAQQIEWNKQAKELSKAYGIPLIHGNDSHYILEKDKEIRDTLLKGKEFAYDYEDTFMLDYPNYDEILNRYERQGVFTRSEGMIALDNTCVFERAEDLGFTKDIKMPSIYKNLSLKERENLLKKIVFDEFKKYASSNNIEVGTPLYKKYQESLADEMDVISKTNEEIHIADYFLLNYKIVKEGEKLGGKLTKSGRGSAVSYLMNKLLGFTEVDRLKATVPLYPSRFIATARLLESRSLPDIDMNMVDDEPFIKASKSILGQNSVYRVVSYGTMQDSSAFKNLCRAKGIEASISNEISKNLEKYYEDPKWKDLIDESKKYIGVIENISPSPCSFVMHNDDIRRKIGVRRVKNELCACIDGYTLDVWKFLKNDFLIVSVWDIIYKTFEKINKPVPNIDELLELVKDNVWVLYEKGITCTLNQADSDYATALVKRYRPKSIAELCSFVAIIRPSCASLLQEYIDRKPYTTGTPELDELLESSKARMIYQESLMRYFHWLGIPESETYDIIKKISKKKFKEKELEELKEHLKQNWLDKVGNMDNFEVTWEVVEAAAGYGFNASHAYCVALDSLYGAYLKANYPLEYYEVVLNIYENDKDRTNKLIKELDYFGIKLHNILFGKSKGGYMADKKTNSIYRGIGSLKGFNQKDGDSLFELYRSLNKDGYLDKKRLGFKELLPSVISIIGEAKTKILIGLDYFKEFGKSLKLLHIWELYTTYAKIKQIKKDKDYPYVSISTLSLYCNKETEKQFSGFDGDKFLDDTIPLLEDKEMPIPDKIKVEREYLGYITYTNPEWKDMLYCQESKKNSTGSKITLSCYKLDTGESVQYVVKNKNRLNEKPIAVGTFFELLTDRLDEKFRINPTYIQGQTKEGDKWIPTGEYDTILVDWKVIYSEKNEQ